MSLRSRFVGALYLLAGVWNVGGGLYLLTAYGPLVRDTRASTLSVVAMMIAGFALGIASTVGACGYLLGHEWGRRALLAITQLAIVVGLVASGGLAVYAVWNGQPLAVLAPLLTLAAWWWLFSALKRALRAD